MKAEPEPEPEPSYPKPLLSYHDEVSFSEGTVSQKSSKDGETPGKPSRLGNIGTTQKWGDLSTLVGFAKSRKFKEATAEAEPPRPPTGTRVLGGELDDECMKMVLHPGGGYHALEAERKAMWKPITKEEQGNEKQKRFFYVLDRVEGQ